MSNQLEPQMVNIPTETVIRALEGVARLGQVEARQLMSIFAASMGAGAQLVTVPVTASAEAEVLVRAVRQVVAERLIFGDRSQPLIDRSRVIEIIRIRVADDQEILKDEEGAALLDAIIGSLVDAIVGTEAPEMQHERGWKCIHAYLALEGEVGAIDAENESHRNEYTRRWTTPEEWSKSMHDTIEGLSGHIMQPMRSIMEQLIGDDASSKEPGEEWREFVENLNPVLKRMRGALQSHQDKRFIEIWTDPLMNS